MKGPGRPSEAQGSLEKEREKENENEPTHHRSYFRSELSICVVCRPARPREA